MTSTIARLLTGTLSDFFAPAAVHLFPPIPEEARRARVEAEQRNRPTLSRMVFLLPSALVLSLGYLLLSTPLPLINPPLLHLTTSLVGFGYGGAFSLTPIIINVVWGTENFATNWGIVAMMPAIGAALWGVIYSTAYEKAVNGGRGFPDGQCHGWGCYGAWAVTSTISVWIAIGVWIAAWRGWKKRGIVV